MQLMVRTPQPVAPVLRGAGGLPEDLVWVGQGARPSAEAVERAVDVLVAVPLAGAAGWSVNGHPWTCHPRRLRTAIVRPSGDWSVEVLRGVREVDCLTGPMIVRRSHLDRLDPDASASRRIGDRRNDPVRVLSRIMRASGFRLLLLGDDHG